MERLDWLTHEKSTALYLNQSYDRISFDSSIQPECRDHLYEEAILSNLKKLGYAIRERYRMDFTTPLQATNPFMNVRDQMYRLWLYLGKQRQGAGLPALSRTPPPPAPSAPGCGNT